MADRLALATWRIRRPTRLEALAWRFNRRSDRFIFGAIAVGILLLAVRDLVQGWSFVVALTGHDFNLYVDAAARWLAGGPFYPESQLVGTFPDDGNAILYPPTALWFLGALAVIPRWLAGALWFAFPFVVLAWQWARMRPFPILWPFLAMIVAWPPTLLSFAVWNSGPVFVGLLALATRYHWPAALIGLKPSVLPFAFWGANRRSWWVTVLILGVASIPFGTMWLDWFRVLGNSQEIDGIWHSVDQWPMFLWPILVWLGASKRSTGTVPRSGSSSTQQRSPADGRVPSRLTAPGP